MRKVLIAYDGSEASKRALQYVIDFTGCLARPLEVHVVNVQNGPVIYGDYITGNLIEQINDGLLATAQRALDEAGALLKAANVSYELHPAIGNVPEQIESAIRQLSCDTVVMGTRGLGSIGGLLLGSVANRVIHDVSVPVVLIK
ncbi:nucleotide-binding universal stress UspA family protein [Pseudomonas sp. JUb42]|jgi:nucleotide-binding universal stress UspA family protein|uniref:universal stress protein n=1 Tax=Pseudomonas sp. JUb42 TaxID=2940611 RepID=UPI00216955D8|nr:universal stress protein [Pseudomonas sp. JUb42]MCS3467315.1 nucleotide-binding universal stress UspA family protein [Pseudomonas sp. JUb42]